MQAPIRIELPTLYGMKTVNAWLFPGPEPVLIDCGEKSAASWAALEKGLAQEGLAMNDLSRVIITHAHVDHIGMAGELTKRTGVPIWVPEYAREWAVDLEAMRARRMKLIDEMLVGVSGKKDSPIQQVFHQVFSQFGNSWEAIPDQDVHTFPMEGKLEIGGGEWEVIYAPGHCINQVCLYQREQKWLLSADMLLSITPTPVIDPDLTPPYLRAPSMLQLLASYERMRELEIEQVFPGHYAVFGQAQELIDKQVTRIHRRKREVLSLVQKGESDFFTLFRTLYKNPMNLPGVPMLLGYLDILETEGQVQTKIVEGKTTWHVW